MNEIKFRVLSTQNAQPWIFRIAARVIVIGMIVMGFGLSVGSGIVVWRTKTWLETSVTTTGTVTAQSMQMQRSGPVGAPGRNTSASSRPTRAEVVEFTAADGTRIEFRSKISSSDPFAVGATVPVRYNPADPADATIDTWFRLWGFPLIFLAVGVLEMCVGIIFLAVSRRVSA
ncbi:MAG: hypothetical protein RIR10_1814 [Planctomycetota bacterium]|jgi:hypothetical protein